MPNIDDGWARLTIRLPAGAYQKLERIAGLVPGLTPTKLIRMMIDQATPELEQLAQAADEQSRGRPGNALHLLLSLSRSLQEGVGGAQEIVQDRLDALAQGGTEPEHPAPQRQNAQPLQHHPSPRKDMATHDQSSRP